MSGIDITHTSIWLDVKDIIKPGNRKFKFALRGMIHTEKEDFPVYKIMALDGLRDYHNKIGESLTMSVKIPLGDYIRRLYPYIGNLEFTIKTIELQESNGVNKRNVPIKIDRYKAVFLSDQNPDYTGTQIENYDVRTLNLMDILDVKFQLLDRTLEPLRIKTVSGIYCKKTPETIIRSLMLEESYKVLVDGKPSIQGVDLVEPNNKEPEEHVVLGSGIHLTSLPSFLHEKCGGVYNAGIGTFLQRYEGRNLWFIYPLYDSTRFDKTTRKLIVYAIPREKLAGIDRTYRKEADIVSIIVTGDKKFTTNLDMDDINFGSGYRMSDARSFMRKPVMITEDGPKAVRSQLNHEIIASERSDGLNYAPMSSRRSSGNPFVEYSALQARRTALIEIVWENADPDLIYPGMPCKYVYLDADKVVTVKGTVVSIAWLTALTGMVASSEVYNRSCIVTLATEQKPARDVIPKTSSPGIF